MTTETLVGGRHRHRSAPLGWAPAIAIGTALAVAAIAAANSAARDGDGSWPGPVFWTGLILILLPTAVRLMSVRARRPERLVLVTTLVVALYLVKVLYEPTQFALHDELGQLRTTNDILASGHLYSFNPIVRAYPYFPGMNLATAALVRVSRLSEFAAGTVIVGVARSVGGLALYLLVARITRSYRLAAIGLLVYAANPSFLYFDAQYAYESLALELAFVALLAVALPGKGTDNSRWPPRFFATLMVLATVVTHHLASYWVVAVLIGWSGLLLVIRRRPQMADSSGVPVWPAIAGLVAVLAWQFGVVRGVVLPELKPIIGGVKALASRLSGQSGQGKTLFKSATGQGGDGPWAQLIGFASVGLALAVLPFGLWRLVRKRRLRHPMALVLGALAVLFPLTLALRLTQSGTETSSRASEYLYTGIGILAGSAAGYLPGMPGFVRRNKHRRQRPYASGATLVALRIGVYATVSFVGGFIVGWPPYERQPGPYLAAAETRSVEPIGVQSAQWAEQHIPAGTFIATDLTNGLLMSAYGRLNPQTGSISGITVPSLFYAHGVGPDQRRVITGDKIAYVVVDRRIGRFPPYGKGYFSGAIPAGVNPALPLPMTALTKFDRAPQFTRVYDAGSIVIYSTGLS